MQNQISLTLSVTELRALLKIASDKSKGVYGGKVKGESTVTLYGKMSEQYPDMISSPSVTVCGLNLLHEAHK